MPNNVGRLGVVLGLNTAEFVAGIENAGKKLDAFVSKIGAVAKVGATALAAMSVAAIKFADDIADVAEANEVTIDTVVKLRSALQNAGGEADKAGVMLASFAKFIDNAASGSFEAQQAFKAVGVSLKDIGSMTQEQLLGKVLDGLAKMDDAVTRTAKSTEFFSKAAKGVAFDKFAQEMSKTTDLTREQIEAVKAGAETWGNLENIIKKLQMLLVTALGPSLKAINSQISEQTFPKIEMLGNAFNFLASNINSAYKAMQSVAILLEKIAGYSLIMQTYGESNAGAAELKKLDEETARRLEEIKKQQEEFDKILNGDGGGMRTDLYPKSDKPNASGKLRDTTVGVDTKAKAAEAEAKRNLEERRRYTEQMMKDNEDELEKRRTFSEQMIKDNESVLEKRRTFTEQMMKDNEDAAEKRYQLSLKEMDTVRDQLQLEEQKKNLQEGTAVELERVQFYLGKQFDAEKEIFLLKRDNKHLSASEMNYAERILQIRKDYEAKEYDIKMLAKSQVLTLDDEAKALERNNELRQRSIDQAKEQLMEIRKQTEGTMTQGVQKGFDEYIKNLPTQFEVGRRGFVSLMSSMENAVEQFVRTGKFNFGDFTRSVIMDMMVIQAKASAMNMMRGLGNIFGFGSQSVDLGYGGETFGAVRASGYADGGDPPVNRVSIVGERGPELFVPRTAGTIIPNNQLANAMGGGQTVNYNGPYIANMSAIDTQTGVQFLAKNKQTIWASYQSANRSVPVSR